MPSTGWIVVNGYSATFGRAFEIRASSDDLPAFGRPAERRVGEQLEPELELALLAGKPGLGVARRLSRRRREALVAAAAEPAAGDDDARAGSGEVGYQLVVFVEDLRPDGHDQLDGLAVGAVLAAHRCRCRRGRP